MLLSSEHVAKRNFVSFKQKGKTKRKSEGKSRLPLKMSLKLLLTIGGRELIQRKQVEPWRQGDKRFWEGRESGSPVN